METAVFGNAWERRTPTQMGANRVVRVCAVVRQRIITICSTTYKMHALERRFRSRFMMASPFAWISCAVVAIHKTAGERPRSDLAPHNQSTAGGVVLHLKRAGIAPLHPLIGGQAPLRKSQTQSLPRLPRAPPCRTQNKAHRLTHLTAIRISDFGVSVRKANSCKTSSLPHARRATRVAISPTPPPAVSG